MLTQEKAISQLLDQAKDINKIPPLEVDKRLLPKDEPNSKYNQSKQHRSRLIDGCKEHVRSQEQLKLATEEKNLTDSARANIQAKKEQKEFALREKSSTYMQELARKEAVRKGRKRKKVKIEPMDPRFVRINVDP